MEGEASTGSAAAGQGAAAASDGGDARGVRTCPKCGLDCSLIDVACHRCGLLLAHFERFADDSDPPGLDAAWSDCLEGWDQPALHDHLLDVASALHCLPRLARRYRFRLEAGPDPISEKRLAQIGILIETATRAQAREGGGGRLVRVLSVVGHLMAAVVLLASAWVMVLALRRH